MSKQTTDRLSVSNPIRHRVKDFCAGVGAGTYDRTLAYLLDAVGKQYGTDIKAGIELRNDFKAWAKSQARDNPIN